MTAVLFPLGRVVATPGALSLVADAGVNPVEFLERHRCGDWGEVPPADARENDLSVLHAAIGRHGSPKATVTDGGAIFRSDRAKAVYAALGIRKEEIERGQP
jgi:hypothetical protein